MASEDGCCCICHETYLDKPGQAESVGVVGVLKCGHAYHRHCIVMWFAAGKCECPQCKKKCRIDDVRTLDFDVKPVPRQSAEELMQLEAATLEEREKRREELSAEKEKVVAVSNRVDTDLAALRDLGQEYKRQRTETRQQVAHLKEEHMERSALLYDETTTCNALRVGIDAEAPARLQRKLQVNQPREGDVDLVEERRRLRGGTRTMDRSFQLHDALASAQQQDSEKMRDKGRRETARANAEAILRELAQQEVQLRREFDDLKMGAAELSSQASQTSIAASSQTSMVASSLAASISSPNAVVSRTPSGTSESGYSTDARRRKVSVEIATPLGGAELRIQDEDEDADMLYSGGSLRRQASGTRLGLALAGATPGRGKIVKPAATSATAGGGAKWGALFKSNNSGARAEPSKTQPQPLLQAPPRRSSKSSSIQTLFANRQL